ncbi:hypothetical protein BDQ94DRAFT_132445 [Aspergillus welwitschiae]|uniref:Uncharacterized protein n=1 Tax=Aspergillus welwitschiae TaxID=1341132 RepID=A0A3F3QJJ8_9EURO|nr:hypothetical protein BDQ94DRAFT_132445 [Aspergillus welwitschiae]RDH39129.1 hypothetical protein BDQ94DRAFT_132445 [Aspergillus welwitschiae]
MHVELIQNALLRNPILKVASYSKRPPGDVSIDISLLGTCRLQFDTFYGVLQSTNPCLTCRLVIVLALILCIPLDGVHGHNFSPGQP